MASSSPHIAIIGAGPGGLCLAQGLKRQGISFELYERDESLEGAGRNHRIRIDSMGRRALAQCLPPALYGLLEERCALPTAPCRLLDTQLRAVSGRHAIAAHALCDEEVADLRAHRLTLRAVLASGIGDQLHMGKSCHQAQELPDGTVSLQFSDGSQSLADIVVAADGAGSLLRRQRLPAAEPVETGAVCIHGHAPFQPHSASDGPLLTAPSLVVVDGMTASIDPMRFHAPDETDRLSWSITGPVAAIFGEAGNLSRQTSARAQAAIMELTRGWAPALRALFQRSDPGAIHVLPVRSAMPLVPWAPSRITLLGDAIHPMDPAGGVGANSALDDAARLAAALGKAARGAISLPAAIAEYEADMRIAANDEILASRRAVAQLLSRCAAIRENAHAA
ncbi:FAD-dependent oxidoreductase [Novosphingobium terrae]|uniref:FAD-dependent oxidoreductase n=1 Tax=Novosphingobium terrae TaxID=2726189 RepID=UPI001980BC47|nr:FAD-dependent monooxygenase [Novosphingobium terrae]